MSRLPPDFYRQADTVQVAKQLLGKRLCTQLDGVLTTGLITETEAYLGAADKACHAHGYKRTARTEPMFAAGGIAYVYLCYGIHHLFNVVTHAKGEPHAVLIRAIKPEAGIDTILQRRNQSKVSKTTSGGPGTLSQALGIRTTHTGTDLRGSTIWIEDAGIEVPDSTIEVSTRIGVGYAEEDALLPYRFVVQL